MTAAPVTATMLASSRKRSAMEKILEALRNPTIFNGLAVLSFLGKLKLSHYRVTAQ